MLFILCLFSSSSSFTIFSVLLENSFNKAIFSQTVDIFLPKKEKQQALKVGLFFPSFSMKPPQSNSDILFLYQLSAQALIWQQPQFAYTYQAFSASECESRPVTATEVGGIVVPCIVKQPNIERVSK